MEESPHVWCQKRCECDGGGNTKETHRIQKTKRKAAETGECVRASPGERRGPAPSPTLHLPSLPLTPSFRTSSRRPCPQLTPTPCVQQATGLLVHPLLLQAAQTRRSIPTPHAGPSSALLVVPAVSFLHLPPPSPSFSHSMKIMEKKVRNTGRKRGGEMESVSGSYQE